jgi:hypothetical protein
MPVFECDHTKYRGVYCADCLKKYAELKMGPLVSALQLCLKIHELSGCTDTCWFPKDVVDASLNHAAAFAHLQGKR